MRQLGFPQRLSGIEIVDKFLGQENRSDIPLVLAALNRSDSVRYKSSSGGIFYALASWVIERGGVVYGCAFDEGLNAVHVRCEDLAACELCMGSKYSQSNIGESIAHVIDDLRSGTMVLFSGTPCQVAAVKRVVDIKAPHFVNLLITCDIVCHGVPSPALFASHISFIEHVRGKGVTAYWHRPKDKGHHHIEKIKYEDETTEIKTRLSDSWRRLFYDDRMLRPSCYVCPYAKLGRCSDITLADYWKIANTPLSRVDDGKGVSLILVSSCRGAEILRDLARDQLDMFESCVADALPGNPMLERPTTFKGDRNVPWNQLYDHGYESLLKINRWYPTSAWYGLRRLKKAAFRLMRKVHKWHKCETM